jgi:Protein of unknown function (DUF1501)
MDAFVCLAYRHRDCRSTELVAQFTSLQQQPETGKEFDLSREPEGSRQRYGCNKLGQSYLLSRRLVEAGVRFVTCDNPADFAATVYHAMGIDSHAEVNDPLGRLLMLTQGSPVLNCFPENFRYSRIPLPQSEENVHLRFFDRHQRSAK